jgi:hypothetical protein
MYKCIKTLLIILSCQCDITAQVSQCLIDNGVVKQNCVPIGDAYIENSCIAGIHRQIARTVNAEDLVEWIWPNTCWGITPNPPINAQVNCSKPYDLCYSHFCPDKYCSIIKTIVELKASLIARAANPWGKAGVMDSNSSYYFAMKQMIIDLNNAYDCAQLRRPVIQGGIFEFCDQSVSYVSIPESVINEFRNDPDFDNSYYLNLNGTPKKIKFTVNRINFVNGGNLSNCPDITRIEARMWFFHCSKIYIDLGFKSIHMGQMQNWDKLELNSGYSYAIQTINRIRNYAKFKNTFVLLTEENFKSLKYPNSNMFIYDFDVRAIRVREVSTPQVCGDFHCNTPVNNYLTNSSCELEQYPGVIDSCVITNSGISGGYSPINSCYLQNMPYCTYFDFSEGITPPEGVATSGYGFPCYSNKESVWGWDDTKWFSEKISTNCREFWMGDAVCRLRNYHNSSGFMIAPILLCVKRPENYNNASNGMIPTSDGRYLISDEINVKNEVFKKWMPNNNTNINITKTCEYAIGLCSRFPLIYKKQNRYKLKIENPDCSTIYTWHIQNPNGTWQNFTYGNEREFFPPVTGYYKIYLRHDNLAGFLNSSYYGIKELGYYVFMYKDCCGGNLLKNRVVSNNDKEYEGEVEFEEISINSIDYIDVIRSKNRVSDTLIESKISLVSSDKIILTPNPVVNFLNLSFNDDLNLVKNVLIFDIYGYSVFSKIIQSDQASLDVSELKSGIYLLKVTYLKNNKNYYYKFIKE